MEYSVWMLSITILSTNCKYQDLAANLIYPNINAVHVGVSTTTLTPNLGELCPGQVVVLTCSTSEDTMEWLYNGVEIDRSELNERLDPVGASISLQASGFMFSAEVISIRPPVFATTLSFSTDAAMNGDSVSCRAGGQTSTQIIQVVQRGKRSACDGVLFLYSVLVT